MGCLVFRSGYQTCQECLWSFFYVGPGCFCAESDPKRQRKVCCFQELYFFVLSLVSNPLRALNTNQPNTILEQKIPPQTCWHEVSIPSPQGWYTPCWLSQRWWSRVYVTKTLRIHAESLHLSLLNDSVFKGFTEKDSVGSQNPNKPYWNLRIMQQTNTQKCEFVCEIWCWCW